MYFWIWFRFFRTTSTAFKIDHRPGHYIKLQTQTPQRHWHRRVRILNILSASQNKRTEHDSLVKFTPLQQNSHRTLIHSQASNTDSGSLMCDWVSRQITNSCLQYWLKPMWILIWFFRTLNGLIDLWHFEHLKWIYLI